MRKNKLAIVAISGNEQQWVEQWCKSVLSVNPDYVVFNLTQYDDDTEKLVKQFIPSDILTFVKYSWEKDFSKARNQCQKHVPKDADYCMYVDLDEVITETSLGALESFLNTGTKRMGLITILNSLEQKGLLASLYYPRLYPNLDDRGKPTNPRFDGVVHNQLLMDKDFPVERTEVYILHYGYGLDKEKMAEKHKRSEELLRGQIKENNDSFFSHLNLAQLLRARGDFEGTEKHANEVLRVIEPNRSKGDSKYDHAYIMAKDQLGTSCLATGRPKEAIEHFNGALGIKVDHLDSILNMGNCYFELRDLDKAEYWYKRYLFIRSKYDEMRDNTNLILNHLNSSFIALYNLGMVYAHKGDMDKAIDSFEKCYKQEPEFKDVFLKYIHGLKILNKKKEFNDEINKFINLYPQRAHTVYDYLSDMALLECNVELSKFNLYQAAHINSDESEIEGLQNKWKELSKVFGEVSLSFFDTDKVVEKTRERAR